MLIKVYALLGFGLGANYLFTIVLARLLGPENFGAYAYALNIFNIASLVAVMGLDQAAIRFIAQHTAEAFNFTAYISRRSIQFALLGCACIAVLAVLSSDSLIASSLFLFSGLCISFVVLTVRLAILQAHHVLIPRMLIKYGIEPTAKMLLLLGIVLLTQITAQLAVVCLIVASVFANLYLAVRFRSLLLKGQAGTTREVSSRVNAFVLPLSISNLVNVLAARLDLIILGLLVSNLALGQYSAAVQTAAIIAIVLQGMEMIYTSRFSHLLGTMNTKGLAEKYQESMRISLLIGTPLFVVFLCHAEHIMLWFGEQYADAAPVLVILSCAQFMNLATGSANSILIMLGKTRTVLANSCIYALLITIFAWIGAQEWGLAGAALGVALSNILLNILRLCMVFHYLKIWPYSRYLWKIILALAASYWANQLLALQGIEGIVFSLASTGLLLLILGLHDHEKHAIRQLLRIKKESLA